VGLSFRFPDHHDYREKDLNKIVRETKEKNIDTIITTEKDAVRLMPLSVSPSARLSVFVLRIELKIIQDEIFTQRIHSLY
jgi:tetraacyldisaccharide 4'-kinase